MMTSQQQQGKTCFFFTLRVTEVRCRFACPSPAITEQMLIFQFKGLLRIHDKGKLYMRIRIFFFLQTLKLL